MKKISTLIAAFAILSSIGLNAQRYLTEVFTDVDVTSGVTYGVNATVIAYTQLGQAIPEELKMDIYEPNGDTETDRPLILYFHTGNFLPHPQNGGPSGTRTDLNVVEMCSRLARMGYVVASCDYRLGWNPVATEQDERVYTLINAAYRGVQDCRTAIRYFRKSVAESSDPYGIDPSRICVWGQGAGGYIAFAAATINNYSDIAIPKFTHEIEVPPGSGNMVTVPMVLEAVNGDIYGTIVGINPNDGDTLCYINHPGYDSDFNVMVNMGGACGDSSWVTANDPPMISFHAPSDPFAPYNVGTVIVPGFNLPVVEVSGSYHVQQLANALNLNQSFLNADLASDVYTVQANLYNDGAYGLYPLNRPAGSEADSAPWEWWTSDNVNNATGLLTNPDMSQTKGETFLDSIQAYAAPRIMCALALPGSPCETPTAENDLCVDAIDINPAFAGAVDVAVSSGPYSNANATGGDLDVADVTACWFDDLAGNGDGNNPEIDNTVWFTFEGDGDEYIVIADDCDGTSDFAGDTQMIIYAGDDCNNLTPVACNDDISTANNIYWAGVLLETTASTTYYIAIDGFNYTGFGSPDDPLTTGDFCIQVQQTIVNVEENSDLQFVVYPNPTKDNFTIQSNEMFEGVRVHNMVGDLVYAQSGLNTKLYRIDNVFAPGVYTIEISTANGTSISRVVVE
ncbi:MAG: T9SS type A sorting domain-containing protein [Flavobacteriales bacterium]|nr:T9SS type A sorting domain-containing protein [Flavobacteriales bacterium]